MTTESSPSFPGGQSSSESEPKTTYSLLLRDLPEGDKRIFGPDCLTFICLPKLQPGQKDLPSIRGVRSGCALVHFFDPKANRWDTVVSGPVNYESTPPELDWPLLEKAGKTFFGKSKYFPEKHSLPVERFDLPPS